MIWKEYGKTEKISIYRNFKSFHVTVQDGGKMSTKTGVKLAYKSIFVLIFTSDGHPMLLDRIFRSRRYAVLNCYNIIQNFQFEIKRIK